MNVSQFPRDFTRFCPLRQAKLSFSLQFIFFALLRRNPCLIEIVSRIYLSLFNFIRRLSTAPRVTCHPDLVVYHWCHRTAAMKRIRALQCASFLRGGEFRGCFAKCMNVAVVKLKTVTFPFFFIYDEISGLIFRCSEDGILSYEFSMGWIKKFPFALRTNKIYLLMNYLWEISRGGGM